MKKIALITGATGDIGNEIATRLSKEGYELILCGNKSEFKFSGNFFGLKFDVSQPEQVKKAFDEVKNKFSQIDLLVHCAGIAEKESLIIDKSDEEIAHLVSVNLCGTIFVNKYALPLMRKGGQIINISSFLGESGCSCEATYSATKAGVIALTKSLAQEFAPFGVRVNAINPGYINTKMNSEFSAEDKRRLAEQTPLGRLGTPSDVADAVLMLERCSFITGEAISVTGGLRL